MIKKKRVLAVVSGNIESGGIETYLKQVYEHMNLEDMEVDILVPGGILYETYATAFQKCGCSFIVCNFSQHNRFRYWKLYCVIKNVLQNKKYDLIHVNTGNIVIQTLALSAACKAGVLVRIAHSHGTVYYGSWMVEFVRNRMRSYINRKATIKLACSNAAALSLFGKNGMSGVTIAGNGIETARYRFDESSRKMVREENGWGDKLVIGSVGRFSEEKNYSFVLHVFKYVHLKDRNTLLVLAGDGEERERLQQEAIELGISDAVQFLGVRKDIPLILQGYDVFVLSSKREALGIVNIEAQATGLPCVVSDNVPRDIDVTGRVSFLSLKDSVDIWADEILKRGNYERHDMTDMVKLKGYDIEETYRIIDILYHKGR